MKRNTLLILMLALTALPAAAQELGDGVFSGIFAQPLPHVAQLTQEERRALRERWERATPEERAALRRAFMERMQRMPPQGFVPGGMDMRRGWRDMQNGMGPAMDFWRDDGYGTGYERRRYEEQNESLPDPGRGDNGRRGRGRR